MTKKAILFVFLCGCSSASAPVSVHFSGSNAMPAPGAGYNADVGTVGSNQDMQLVLDSKAGGAELKISVDKPTTTGAITIGNGHIDVEYTLSAGGPTWVSNSGAVDFQTVDSPYMVTFDHVEMIGSAATGASGAFFLDGSGTFQK
jgi:hypothetical protein